VVAEDCHSHDHAGYGMHPGSGSQRSLIRGNRLTGNNLGLFLCWGVKWALAEKNYIEGNRGFGVSIGHNDTDNLIRDNDIRQSGEGGVLFRQERDAAFQGNRNRIEKNRIHGLVGEKGVAIDIQGRTNSIQIEANDIRETQAPAQRIGIRIGEEAGQVTLVANRIEGFAEKVLDLRKPS
jgi:nitrous oxidase accessory protein NosD